MRSLLLLFAALQACTEPEQPQAHITFDFRDPTLLDTSADATLDAIGSLCESSDSPTTVRFMTNSGSPTFTFSTGELANKNAITVCYSHLFLDLDRLYYDDEEISLETAKTRIAKIVEAARLTDSRASYIITAFPTAKNSNLAQVLEILHAEGITHLITESGRMDSAD